MNSFVHGFGIFHYPFPLYRLFFCPANRVWGQEFLAFYSYKADGVFSAERCVRGKQYGRYYVFEFPIGTNQIRIDTGVHPSITVSFQEILANKYTFNTVMRFSTGELFYLLAVPGVIYGVLDLISGIKIKGNTAQF